MATGRLIVQIPPTLIREQWKPIAYFASPPLIVGDIDDEDVERRVLDMKTVVSKLGEEWSRFFALQWFCENMRYFRRKDHRMKYSAQ